ncbi:hypothetical protein M885DRAFT_615124 [Pelagophyceae sp. CCMP2097]|nr:hypothetical protein M885DRAFT_615124 [Pelagophyceae sp. CCMP2097]
MRGLAPAFAGLLLLPRAFGAGFGEVVLHANSDRERRAAAEVIRQVRVECHAPAQCPRITLWTSSDGAGDDTNLADETRRYSTVGAISHVFEALAAAVEGQPLGGSVLSLDLKRWAPCARFGAWVVHGSAGEAPLAALPGRATIAMATAPRRGWPTNADLVVLMAAWTTADGAAAATAYIDGARAALARDARVAKWMTSTATDISREAAHSASAVVDASTLPDALRCDQCGRGAVCFGADAVPREKEGRPRQLKSVHAPPNVTAMGLLADRVYDDAPNRARCLRAFAPGDGAASAESAAQARRKRPTRVVLVSGVNVRKDNRADVDFALTKRAYAAKHGYDWQFYVAEAFAWKVADFPWEFSKILMLQDAAHAFPDAKWVVWVDADMWFNPRFTHLPLELWLDAADVAADKLVVISNFRGLNTGVAAVRGGPHGRALLARWYAVARAGLAQCHPHDQAALQMLQLWHMNGSNPETRAPYDYRCVKNKSGICDAEFWSCIPLWRRALTLAHALKTPRFNIKGNNWDVGEAVDRGFANADTPLFHVTTESKMRPKLQCFQCLTSLEKVSFVPGKNFKRLHEAARDGWLLNHKGKSLFYSQAFRASKACDV